MMNWKGSRKLQTGGQIGDERGFNGIAYGLARANYALPSPTRWFPGRFLHCRPLRRSDRCPCRSQTIHPSSAINRAEGLPRSILKHLPNRAFEPITELLQGLQGDVLVPHLKPVQGGIRQPSFPCKLLIRKVSALLSEPSSQLFSQSVLCHEPILRLAVSHKWDFCLASFSPIEYRALHK
jgi:hypothetical protein